MMTGGHLFTFTQNGDLTRVDHELVMTPRGVWKLMTPLMGFMGKRNLRRTADALQRHLEG